MKHIFILLLSLLAFQGFAQVRCGTTFADQEQYTEQLKANIEYAIKNAGQTEAVTYIPVHFHLTADSEGNGRTNVKDVFNIMCTLNRDFEKHGIQFFMVPHATNGLIDFSINNNNVFENQTNTFLMKLRKHSNALNYYVVGTAQAGNQQPGTIAAYYTPANDWVVIDDGYTALGESTTSHETGHFFSLRHTFYGWESDAQDWENEPPCFDPNDPGWPCAPLISPDGTPTEKADGSNCASAADLICDTPPDYNFGYCATDCPPYSGPAKDPNCQAIDPMEHNFMSYYFSCVDYEFTPGQEAVMKADIASSKRNFLDNTYTPPALTINTPTDLLVSPVQNEILNDDDTAVLSWNTVPGATWYFVEVDITTVYASPQLQFFLVENSNTVTVTGLTPNKKYNWRVRPFNEYYVCATPRQRTFTTGKENTIDSTDELLSWTVTPNPASSSETVSVSIATTQAVDEISIAVFDAAGRQVYSQDSISLAPGQTNIALPGNRLSQGFYFVTIQYGDKKETKQLVIIQ